MLRVKHEESITSKISTKLLWIALATACYSGNQLYANSMFNPEKIISQQKIKVKGKVIDEITKSPLSGVSIRSNGTAIYSTKIDGSFEIDVVSGSTISFQLIGFGAKTQTFNSATDNVTITLLENAEGIDEVVVTALGIKREEKSLGYSVSTLSGDELTESQSANWTDALTGKVAGLNLVKSGGGPAGTNQIILRGENSLTGDNSALIVIDGVITSSSSGRMTSTGNGNYLSDDAPVDFGTGLADINPDDIESISVLKGPGATALYGSRGANGAIIITTKQGKKKSKGLGINLTSNTTVGYINRWPDYQNQFGAGVGGNDFYYSYGQSADGASTYSTSAAWGPKFNGQSYFQYDSAYYRQTPPERTLWRAYENNKKDFFETTFNTSNNLSYANSTDRTSTRISLGNTINTWMVPNTGFNRTTASVQMSHKITDKVTVQGKVSYNNKNSDNLPTTGYNNGTIMYFMRGLTPNMDINWFKNYWIEENVEQNTPMSTLLDNPYLQAYEMLNAQNRDGFLGNTQIDYKINDEFSVMGRMAIDASWDGRTQRRPFDSNKYAYGHFRKTNVFNAESNMDFLARYRNERNKGFKWGANLGGARMLNTYRKVDVWTNKLVEGGIYSFENSAEDLTSKPYKTRYAVNSVYGMANFEFKNVLFLDVTSRVDWNSTLASPEFGSGKGFMYNSYNGSLMVSDLFKMPKSINFFKLRASLANVGSGGTTPYLTSYTYPFVPNFENGYINNVRIPNEELEYESTRSVEFGTDLRMFKNRLTFDIAVYQNNTFNQILPVPIDPSSGYTTMVINAGEVRNRGAEFATSYQILKKKDKFNWKMFGNFSYNDGIIMSLPESSEEESIILSTIYGSRGTIEARVGGNYGAMYGYGYERSPDGQIVYKDGYPVMSSDLLYLGRSTAPWKAAWGNEFKYKNFKFNFLFDGQFGGVGYSLTHAVLMEEGKLNKTVPGRYNGLVGKGVVNNGDGTYSANTTLVNARDFYYNHFNRDNLEANTFSTDFIKLREVRIDYTFKPEFLKNYKIQRAVLGLYGRDLLVFTEWPSFDPEFGSLTAAGIQKGAEVAQFPSTRNFGFSLSLSF